MKGIKKVLCSALTFLMLFSVTASDLTMLNALENMMPVVSLNAEKSDLKTGEKTTVKANLNLPEKSEVVSYDWSYDESIVRVNENGQDIEVEAIATGKSKITVVVNYSLTVVKEDEDPEIIQTSETAETVITVAEDAVKESEAIEQTAPALEDTEDAVKATKEIEVETSDKDVNMDPITLDYIRNNIDENYAKAEKSVFSNILLVKNTLAEADKLADNENIDSLMAREDIEEVFIATVPTTVAVYNTDDSSLYYVGVGDTMKNDDTATIIDHCFAINNNNGEVLNNCHFDSETGLVYIPKEYFKNDSDVEVINNVQVQFLQSISNDVNNITSKVEVATVDSSETRAGTGNVDAFDFETKVDTEKNLSKSELTVAVNGVPLADEQFDYNSNNGTVTVASSSAGVDTVTVDVNEKSVLTKAVDKILNIKEVNAATSFGAMNPAGTVTVPEGVGTGWSGHITLFKGYASDWTHQPSLPSYGYSGNETALANLIHGGGNLDYSKLSMQTAYMMVGVCLGVQGQPIFWDYSVEGAVGVTVNDGWLRLQCTHISSPEGNGGEWKQEAVRVRVLDETNDEIVVGFLTKRVNQQTGAGIVKFKKRQKNGALEIQKVSANKSITNGNPCYSLAGAEYQLRDLSNNTVATLITNNEGKASVGEIKAGQYNLVETRASQGFELNSTVTPVTITAGQTTTLNGEGCLSEEPGNDPASIEITKADLDSNQNNPQGNASLEGAEFTIKYYNALYDKVSDLPETATRTWVLKTKAISNGVITKYIATLRDEYKVSGDAFYYTENNPNPTLPIGTMTIQETKAPSGYLLEGATLSDNNGNTDKIDNGVYLTQIKQDGSGGVAKVVAGNYPVVKDRVKKQKVEIEKLTEDRNGITASLNDAEFTIKLKSEVEEKGWDNAKSYDVVTTANIDGKDGLALTKDLPFGTFIIRETGTPAGYVKADDIEFTIDKDQSEMDAVQHFTITNKETHVQLYKYDVETEKALSGVEYLLYNVTSNKEVGRYKTDENGFIDLYKLAGGNEYYIQETKAKNGYEINDTKFYFEFDKNGFVSVSDKNTNKDVFTVNDKGDMTISLSNKLKWFKLNLNKVNDVARKLEGAEFTLYKDKECTQEVMKGSTDVNGNLKFDKVEVGTYWIKETKAPKGYRKLLDPIKIEFKAVNKKHTFYVNDQAITAPIGNNSFTVENDWYVGNMTILNKRGSQLPATGSSMTLVLVGAGLSICLVAVLSRKKYEKGEN